jgi:asparagine synthase (glutamine-hydrolysing)
MCGICGVIGGDRRQVEPAVRRMMRAMIHRGPDDEGYEELPIGDPATGPVAAFGFRRLAILDLTSAGHQPMVHPTTGDCLIFNGEIYNFRDLRRELEGSGATFRGTSDTEVLLHALATWGEAALEKLHGMFALAFYEARTRRILLARDPLGIKPLYVARDKDLIVFASEIRAIRDSGLVPMDLDVAGIASMLAFGAVQSPFTIHEKIRSFRAGTCQWIDATSGRSDPPRRFWDFPRRAIDTVDAPTAAREVEGLLRRAVHGHLVADVPVGVFLSAGIDSTIVASFAREYSPNVTAFTVGFESTTEEDEIEVAAATAASLGIRHVALNVDRAQLPGAWHDWLASVDSPSIDGFNTYLVSRQLAAEGVVVGLSGLGADELFGGYSTFSRAMRLSRLLCATPLVSPLLRSGLGHAVGRLLGRSDAFEKLADVAAGDASVAGVARSLRRALSNRRLAQLGLSPVRAGLAADYLPLPADRWEPPLDGDDFNTVSRMEMVHYMGDTLLRDTDANSMRHSLEVRVPFLDRPLVDYASALPGSVKQEPSGEPKSLLRRACHRVLPGSLLRRPKTGFMLPIGFWMRNQMRDSCDAAVERLAEQGVVDGTEVRRMWHEFLKNPKAMHWSRPLALVMLGNAVGRSDQVDR